MNRTEYFVALALSAVLFDLNDLTGAAAAIHIAFMATLFVCWFNAVRKERKP